MMKKPRNKMLCRMHVLAALIAVSVSCCCLSALPAAAEQEIAVSIDTVSVTPSQLQQQDYQIPVFIRLEQNAGINCAEFVIQADERCGFTCISSAAAAYQLAGEPLVMEMTGSSLFGNQYRRFLWASGNRMQETGAMVLVLLQLPEDAAAGDVFPVSYVPSLDYQGYTFLHLWGRTGADAVEYTSNPDAVTWTDGGVSVIPDATEPPDNLTGDVDRNGNIDIVDVIIVNKRILGKLPREEAMTIEADFDRDGVIAPADSLLLLQYVVGLLDNL